MAVPGLQGDFCGRAVFKGGKKTKMEKRERRRVDWWNALVGSFVCESVFFFFLLGQITREDVRKFWKRNWIWGTTGVVTIIRNREGR